MELGAGETILSGWAFGVPETGWKFCLCEIDLGSVRLFQRLSLFGYWLVSDFLLPRTVEVKARKAFWHLSQKCPVTSTEILYGLEVPSHCQRTSHTDPGLGSSSVGIPGTELFVCICLSVVYTVHCQGRAEWIIDWPGEPHTLSSSAHSLMGILFTRTCGCLIMGAVVRAGIWR